jgi:hypothetical protein
VISWAPHAYVYEAELEPEGILCDVDSVEPDGRREAEIVVDPSHLGPIRRIENVVRPAS